MHLPQQAYQTLEDLLSAQLETLRKELEYIRVEGALILSSQRSSHRNQWRRG